MRRYNTWRLCYSVRILGNWFLKWKSPEFRRNTADQIKTDPLNLNMDTLDQLCYLLTFRRCVAPLWPLCSVPWTHFFNGAANHAPWSPYRCVIGRLQHGALYHRPPTPLTSQLFRSDRSSLYRHREYWGRPWFLPSTYCLVMTKFPTTTHISQQAESCAVQEMKPNENINHFDA